MWREAPQRLRQGHMNKKPLELLFAAMYHEKYDFSDFLSSDVSTNYDVRAFRGKPAYSPNKKLKAYHLFLNTFLCEFLEVNKRVVFSYRKGARPHEAVLAHAKSRAFFQTDIEDFFGSLKRPTIERTLRANAPNVPILDLDEHIHRILSLITVDEKLPVGFATSPHISNACLTPFDDELEDLCRGRGLIYTRYADDLTISGGARESLLDLSKVLQELLNKHFGETFRLNRAKSKLTTVGRKVKLLGLVILPSGQVSIDRELKDRIETRIHFFVDDRSKFMNLVDNDDEAGLEQLCGYVNYVNSVDPAYLEKLQRKFGATVIDSLLHRTAS